MLCACASPCFRPLLHHKRTGLLLLLTTLAGWLFTYYNTKKTDERKAQIERINDQARVAAAASMQVPRWLRCSTGDWWGHCCSQPALHSHCLLAVQVRQLYGPLLACVHASRSAYAAMVRQHSPDGTVQVSLKLLAGLSSGGQQPLGWANVCWAAGTGSEKDRMMLLLACLGVCAGLWCAHVPRCTSSACRALSRNCRASQRGL